MQSARVRNFAPSVSAFAFSNSFAAGIPDIVVNLPAPFNSRIPIGDASNGMCGGMVYAVLDCFLSSPRLHVPLSTPDPLSTPGAGPLTAYIGRRLFDSFGQLLHNVIRYLDFMSTIDHDTLVAQGVGSIIVKQEWPKIKADIDSGRPSPLGLVSGVWVWPTNIAAKIQMLKHCHQVLAYGYELDDANNLKIFVYDPNNPGNDNSTIALNIGSPEHTLSIQTPDITSHIAGHVSFRAFFRHNDYAMVTPDLALMTKPFVLQATASPNRAKVDVPTTMTITAIDGGTGAAVAGSVLVNGSVVGRSSTPFTATFKAKWTNQRTVDPRTHESSWHWVGPNYPSVQVAAPFYESIAVPIAYSGAKPPPPPPDV